MLLSCRSSCWELACRNPFGCCDWPAPMVNSYMILNNHQGNSWSGGSCVPCAQVICALVANDPAKQNWLRSAGLLQVLHRLMLGAGSPNSEEGGTEAGNDDDVGSALGQHFSLGVRRQCARILAILTQQPDALVRSGLSLASVLSKFSGLPCIIEEVQEGHRAPIPACHSSASPRPSQESHSRLMCTNLQGSFQGSGWQRWLEVSAATEDCKLASHARRATLNLQSARTVATAEVHCPTS